MTDTFTWRAEVATSGESEFALSVAQFGDGYRQMTPLGLNNKRKSFTVSVSGYKAYVKAIYDFIESQHGMPFFWKPPFANAVELYSCKRHSEPADQGGSFWIMTMQFEQEFAP